MGTLHLNGTLDLSGSLILGKKVLAGGKEVLVRLLPGSPPPDLPVVPPPAHSYKGHPPKITPPPPDAFMLGIWVTGTTNTTVMIGSKTVVVDKDVCTQGCALLLPGVVAADDVKVTVRGAAVLTIGVKATIAGSDGPVSLDTSGQ